MSCVAVVFPITRRWLRNQLGGKAMKTYDDVQKAIDYRIAETRFVRQWVGRPLKQWLFKKKYLEARLLLFRLTPHPADRAEAGDGGSTDRG